MDSLTKLGGMDTSIEFTREQRTEIKRPPHPPKKSELHNIMTLRMPQIKKFK